MSFLGKKILGLRTRNKQVKAKKNEPLNYETSTSFGLLYTWEGMAKMELIEAFAEQLTDEGKTVNTVCFNPSKEEIDVLHDTVGIESLSSFGKIKSSIVEEFIRKDFDYLILLDFQSSEITSFICNHSRANYKIGSHYGEEEKSFDLMLNVDMNSGTQKYIEEILKYVKIIKHG